MFDREGQEIAEHECVFHHVRQFADVARPAVCRERGEHRRIGDLRPGRCLRPCLVDEMPYERGDVVEPLPERRNRHFERVDAEQEVFAKCSGRHHLLQRAVGGAHDPHVNGDRMAVSDPPDLPALEHPQEPWLQRPGQFSDLVEKDRAAIGHFEEPRTVLVGAGERALAVPEQFALHEMLRQSAAVHGHERPRRPRAALMDRPSHQLLARSRLAAHEHRRIARRHPLDEPLHPLECGRAAHEPRRALGPSHPALQRPEPRREFPLLADPLEDGLDVGQLAGLREIVEHSPPYSGDRAFER